MALSKREKYIAVGTGLAVAVLAVQTLVVSPYVARSTALDHDIDDLTKQKHEMEDTFSRQRRLRPVWADLKKGGLSADLSATDSQTANALYYWAQSAGVATESLQPDRSSTENQFLVSGFRFTGTGRTPAVAQLLWDIETANIPVRLTEVQVAPHKEGTDDLTVQLSISTLTQQQADAPTPKPPVNATAAADGNGDADSEDRS